MEVKDYKIDREPVCPHCGSLNDAATGGGGRAPIPGDFTVCIKCLQFSRYEEDFSLRAMTEADWEEVPDEVRETMLVFKKAAAYANFKVAMEKEENESGLSTEDTGGV